MPVSQPTPVRKHDFGTWPAKVRHVLDGVACFISAATHLARCRDLGHDLELVKVLAQRDAALRDNELLRREADLLRARFGRVPPERRPNYLPDERRQIVWLMRLRKWSPREAACRFLQNATTLRRWLRVMEGRGNPAILFGILPFNKHAEAVRWLVHELRALFPHAWHGTRSIAAKIVQAGIQVSRSSVQRILREKPPSPPKVLRAIAPESSSLRPFHILRPRKKNRTWHLDLTTFKVFWATFTVAALVDGYSRKLLALKFFKDTPTAMQMSALVKNAFRAFSKPRFLVTDHGAQFREQFRDEVGDERCTPVQGKKYSMKFNGKAERIFRTLKIWSRLAFLPGVPNLLQARLDVFRSWYNTARPNQALNGLTPEQKWSGKHLPEPRPIRARNPWQPAIEVQRRAYRGDPHLPVARILVRPFMRKTG